MSDIAKMYETVAAINATAHGDVSVALISGLEFSRQLTSAPVLAAEFGAAASDMAIVFTGDDDVLVPVALLGIKENENLYLNDDAKWTGRYVPAFLRRYPFIFARGEDDTMTLCIDEEYEGLRVDGRGERLFDSDGNRTQYLDTMLNFVTQYQRQHLVTQEFCNRLSALDLLEPASLSSTDEAGEVRRLVGFKVINRQKFKTIEDSILSEMFRSDELELCYLHMHSLQNFGIQLRSTITAATKDEASSLIQ